MSLQDWIPAGCRISEDALLRLIGEVAPEITAEVIRASWGDRIKLSYADGSQAGGLTRSIQEAVRDRSQTAPRSASPAHGILTTPGPSRCSLARRGSGRCSPRASRTSWSGCCAGSPSAGSGWSDYSGSPRVTCSPSSTAVMSLSTYRAAFCWRLSLSV